MADDRVGRDAQFIREGLVAPARGIGKTRLATEVAARAAPRFADDATVVELRTVGDADGVVFAIARAVGLRLSGRHASAAELTGCVAESERLLVLDNCARSLRAMLARRIAVGLGPRLCLHLSGGSAGRGHPGRHRQ